MARARNAKTMKCRNGTKATNLLGNPLVAQTVAFNPDGARLADAPHVDETSGAELSN